MYTCCWPANGIILGMNICLFCKEGLKKRHQVKFCSNKCQGDFQYILYIDKWRSGKKDGNRGISTRNISRHLKRYLIEKLGESCQKCGWNQKHPVTKSVPLEIDHIDGNSENNSEKNLRLLCPNCHALTPFYKNLNHGKGRMWRQKKYIKNN